ncbi:response regulator transcription factor [Glaciecola sp. 1036]|uniref:response regulator transcription factor n=1 Tax=Alteromonadaceae TaxID=72275 RepID=UPI003D031803
MRKKLHILLIEDNEAIATQILDFLAVHGWETDYSSTAKQGIELALNHYFDIIILDLNLPDIDGLEVCRTIKQTATRNIPILMLTARDAFEDKVKGFGQGADDYLTKPFDLRELALRCEAVARRPQLHANTEITQGALSIDTRAHSACWNGQPLKITKLGFSILHKLLEAYPYPVSRSELVQHLWGDNPPESNALKSHTYALRKAFEAYTDAQVLYTISNIGYQLKDLDD